MAEAHLSCTERCIRSGFKFGNTGPHNSRTMMLEEMARCLDVLPPDARRADYRTAIVDRNILGKSTESTRKECFRRLRELYALEPAVPLFGIYRQLDVSDGAARPILSLLVACARDPLLRATIPVILGEVVNVALLIHTARLPPSGAVFAGIDVSDDKSPDDKQASLRSKNILPVEQIGQLGNPDCAITLEVVSAQSLLRDYAKGLVGVLNGDSCRFETVFWEVQDFEHAWAFEQSTVQATLPYGGREKVILWENANGQLRAFAKEAKERLHDADRRGNEAWGKRGVVVSQMNSLSVTLYTGEKFDTNAAVIFPTQHDNLEAIWSFCSSPEFEASVRRITQKLSVTNATLVKVPFDLSHWQKIAAEIYPHGLPKPHSDDPTQWLFNGHPKGSTAPLQVAAVRLLGYRWPRQTGSSFPDCPALDPDGLEQFADADGIVCLNAIKGEQSAAERLRALLAAAFGRDWSSTKQTELLAQVDFAGKSLDEWLRNGFFDQHCQLFHQRPFIWQVWDGLRDGFNVLVNYHRLDRRVLEKLIYVYLGDWVARQKAAVAASEEGSDAKLTAAQELKAALENILRGEAPYDIFVRWKPLEKQPLGWEPNINDGVRLNIRPFVEAGILRRTPKINWKKDRGKDVPSAPWYKVFKGDRINDYHLTLEQKREARGA